MTTLSRMVARALAVLAVAAGAAGCKPDLGSPASLVIGPRVLGVRGTPAEADPGTPVAFDVLAVEPDGTIVDPAVGWSFCHTPKPPAEANAVSNACLDTPDDAGPAPSFMAPLPNDGCMTFGPQPPPVKPGQPQIRPRDPDATGGFYQPVRVTLQAATGTDVAFQLQRITCMLANAPIDVTRVYNTTYTKNLNPVIDRVTLDPDNAATPLVGASAATDVAIAPGATVTLELGWGADVPESYPVWDLASRTLITHRESLRVSWFASDGSFPKDTTGRGEDEMELSARNDWTAPAQPGTIHFWVVLRDSRGGLDFAAFDLTVSP
ncbi:MAG TPA: hypothetical protein VIF57_27660 [Polyangia bacterium]|jgi:hypothetical protein